MFGQNAAAALGQIAAGARNLQQFLGRRDLALQLLQFRQLSPRQRLPALGRRNTFAESMKEPARFGQAEAAFFGPVEHRQPLEYRRIVLPSAADAAGLGQQAGLLVIADRGRGKPRLLRHLANRHSISLLDFKSALSPTMVT